MSEDPGVTAVRDTRLAFEPGSYDPFSYSENIARIFYGIADYLSLWGCLYGLDGENIKIGPVGWRSAWILTFKVTTKMGDPISPQRYDPRLPAGPNAFKSRYWRIRSFVRLPWFIRLALKVDGHIRTWCHDWKYELTEVNATTRWTREGIVVIKMIPGAISGVDPRKHYATHYKHDA